MRDDAKAEIASCEQKRSRSRRAAKRSAAELNARLAIARTAGDQQTEHAIWREAELRRAEGRTAIDAQTNRVTLTTWRLRSVGALGFSFGGKRNPTGERSRVVMTANDGSSRGDEKFGHRANRDGCAQEHRCGSRSFDSNWARPVHRR